MPVAMPMTPGAAMPISDWPCGHLTPMKYSAILADPPWSFRMRSGKGHAKSPEAHYATIALADIAALPVAQLAAPDCYLFLWSTWPHLPQALEVMTAWGFEFVTGGNWTKRTVNGRLAFGTGYVLRSASEPFIIGRIGRPSIASRSERGVILSPRHVPDSIDAVRREHSRKPPEMRAMIDRLLPRGFFCEIFGREAWPGHDVWGKEADRFEGTG